ncbi:hypothetical protein [Streptomyces lydicus]|uniref:hypothetical protein n=1 Tax=Streptomyces lydicus TaxID=47763 RepID=UPI0010139E6E|nr:hypothetical protein [Streptomyces lydicus]MCZ1012300.1 hypothetical protein [Streptomyces lydicus]
MPGPWLEAHALLSRVPSQSEAPPAPPGPGRHGGANFDLGDYETACFAAVKAVEVAVREVSGRDNSLVGMPLMQCRRLSANAPAV